MGRGPYPIFLVLAGLGLGFTPGLPHLELPPEVIFLVFIPPLILSAAFFSSPRDLWTYAQPIGLLAIGLVIATTGGIALVAHYVIGLPWAASFVLGAIVAPTDPVAAEATFRRLGVPDRISTIIGGESLVNDGSALVIYNIARGAVVLGTFSWLGASAEFVLSDAGGALLGLLVGWISTPIYRRVKDPAILVVVSLISSYVVYIAAERVHASGILAVVALGFYIGWQAPKLFTPETRLQSYSFWEVLTFLLDSILFVLVGLQFPAILQSIQNHSGNDFILYAILICLTVVGLRLVWFFTVSYARGLLGRISPGSELHSTWQERLVMSWSGMRGAISLAAALSLPFTVSGGGAFPGRDLILFLTVCVIFATLVVQGLTLPALVLLLNVRDEGHESRMGELYARIESTRSALEKLDELCDEEQVSESARERLRSLYEDRLQRYRFGLEAGRITDEYAESSEGWSQWRREMFKAEREAVVTLRDQGKISAEIMRRIERDIELEELRFSG